MSIPAEGEEKQGILTKHHVILRVQVERLPAEFGAGHELSFAPYLQIRIPKCVTNSIVLIQSPIVLPAKPKRKKNPNPVLAKAVRNWTNVADNAVDDCPAAGSPPVRF